MSATYMLLCEETNTYLALGKRLDMANAPFQGLIEQGADGQPWVDPRDAVYRFVCEHLLLGRTVRIVHEDFVPEGAREVSAEYSDQSPEPH